MSKQPRKQYAQRDMDAAVEAVLLKKMSQRKAAIIYNVPKTTLLDKVKGRYSVTPTSRTVLSSEEENKLVEWLKVTATRGCGKTKEELCLAVQRILNAEGRTSPFPDNKPGPSWFRGFLQRYPNIRLRKTMVLGEQQARVSEHNIRAWFHEAHDSLMKDGIDITQVPPENVFNCDETGFPFFLQGPVVLSDVNNKHPYELGSDTKQQITVLGCCSAGGKVLPPTIIFPGMRWTWHPWDDFGDAHFTMTPNGWMNSEVFLQWLQHTFYPAVAHLPRPVVLFADGHQSHVSMEVHTFCREHDITYYVLPAHASHIVQPLDLVFYGSLKEEWKKSVRDFKAIARVPSVTKATFTRVFKDAWKQAYKTEKVKNAFEASGLSPWNEDRPDYSKCQASQIYGRTVREKDATTASSASNQVHTQEVLQEAIVHSDLLESPTENDSSEPMEILPLSPLPSHHSNVPFDTPASHSLSPSQWSCQPSVPEHHPSVIPASHSLSPSQWSCQPSVPEHHPSVIPASHSLSRNDDVDIGFKVDSLIDHVISCGWSLADMFALRRRQLKNTKPAENESKYKRYLELYNSIVPQASFDNLPMPNNWFDKPTKTRIQAPKYVSGQTFKDFHDNKAKEVQLRKEAAEKKKNERLRKKAEKDAEREAQRERKKTEREAKKKTIQEQRERCKLLKKAKRINKSRMNEMNESDTEDSGKIAYINVTSDEHVDEQMMHYMEHEVDDNVCFDCGDDRDLDG